MSLLGRLFLLFVGVPLLELFVLIKLGQIIGLWPTVGLVVLTGFAGAALARMEGMRTLWTLQTELAKGRLPGQAILDGAAILFGGGLLLTPGILTDVVGFSLLLPPSRRVILAHIRKRLEARLESGSIRVTHVVGFGGPGGQFWGDGETQGQPGEIVVEPDESSS